MSSPVEPLVEASDIEIEESKIEKPKKPRTEAQKAAFAQVIAKREANRASRKEVREREAAELLAEKKEKTEKLILKKAISIKKKEIILKEELDDVSDEEDVPMEVINRKLAKKKARVVTASVSKVPVVAVPVVPKFIFV
jgi:hypothetical protein